MCENMALGDAVESEGPRQDPVAWENGLVAFLSIPPGDHACLSLYSCA